MVDVQLATAGGRSAAKAVDRYTYVAAPSVNAVVPARSSVSGGERVTLRGSGFVGVRSVSFGSTPGTSVRADRTSLTVTAPRHAAGTVDVRVTAVGGTSAIRASDRLTYTTDPLVTAISPSSGTVDGGEQVTVTGSNFTAGAVARFGDEDATHTTVISTTRLIATSPSHTIGRVDVQVRAASGAVSAPLPADEFRYVTAVPPVTDLVVQDATATSVTLRWAPPATPGDRIDRITVGQREGSDAPADLSCCTYRDLGDGTTLDTEAGLRPGTTYAFSVFTRSGRFHSQPVSIVVTTPARSRPDLPTDLGVTGVRADASNCASLGAGCLLGPSDGAPVTLHARISDPDFGSTVQAHFVLDDLGIEGNDSPTQAAAADSAPTAGGAVNTRVDGSVLTAGHVYTLTVTAHTEELSSATSAAFVFRYAPGAPSVRSIVASESTVHRGDTVTFTITATDDNPPVSRVATIYYGFSGSATQPLPVTSNGDGTWTATLTVTATSWGTQNLFAAAENRAGVRSSTATYSYYVAS